MIVALTDDVGARVGEPPHHVHMTLGGGPVDRARVVPGLARVDVEPALEQQLDGREPPVRGGYVQQCPVVRRLACGQVGRAQRLEIPGLRRIEYGHREGDITD